MAEKTIQQFEETEGLVFDIQYFSIHDGPGIRATCFIKGCPLHCPWCHNPESISIKPVLAYMDNKCVRCGRCVKVCPQGVHSFTEDGTHLLDRSKCIGCGACVKACIGAALQLAGTKYTAKEAVRNIMKDKAYYMSSGGGMTVSGGEPGVQADFAEALLALGKHEGIHTAVETTACIDYAILERFAKYTDLFLNDWKITDPVKFKEIIGGDNSKIRANIKKLHDAGATILLRCPIVPDVNDTDDHFKGIADITKEMPNIIGAEVLPYHNLGLAKVDRFGITSIKEFRTPTEEEEIGYIEKIKSFGGRVYNDKLFSREVE